MVANTIMPIPARYMPESAVKLSQPFPIRANTKPMKSSKGRKVLGFDRLSGIFVLPTP
jgi:hypothetical protein